MRLYLHRWIASVAVMQSSPRRTVVYFRLHRCVQRVKFKSFETFDLENNFKKICVIFKINTRTMARALIPKETHVVPIFIQYLASFFNLSDVTGKCFGSIMY